MLVLASCAQDDSRSDAILPMPSPDVITEQDKVTARVLSVGNVGANDLPQDPRRRAVLCSEAIDLLSSRLKAAGELDQTQVRALAVVKAHYEREARTHALGDGGSAPTTSDQPADSARSQEDMARHLMTCLQQLQ